MKYLFLLVGLLTGLCAHGQDVPEQSKTTVALEFQQYPTGAIPGITLEFPVSDRSAISLRGGYNIVRHRELGEHDDERGGGLGFSVGYRKYLQATGNSLLYGVRTDLWFNEVDWMDNNPQRSGTTDVTVLQPTASIGYRISLSEGISFIPSASLGFEINISEEGEPIGQGAIGLVGIEFQFKF